MANVLSALTGDITKAKLTLGGASGSDLFSADAGKTITIQMPFNPSTLRFRAIAGGGHMVTTNIGTQYQNLDPRIEISFTMFVEDIDTTDAFLYERINSGGSAVGLAKSAVNMLSGKSHSVAVYVEGILAALRTEPHSQITFEWGKMKYSGALNTVNARYTMFNTSGNPIKAEIDIRMVCVSKGNTNMKDEWKKKYKESISSLTGTDGLGIDLTNTSALGSLISW